MLDGYGNKVIYAGCIKCFRCGAVYRPAGNGRRWHVLGYRGTEGSPCCDFGQIPDEHCPICRQPPLREKPEQHQVTM